MHGIIQYMFDCWADTVVHNHDIKSCMKILYKQVCILNIFANDNAYQTLCGQSYNDSTIVKYVSSVISD